MDLFGSPPKKMPKRKPAAVAPVAAVTAEPEHSMRNADNLLAAHAAAAMSHVNSWWHPNTGFRPTMSKEEAARRAAALNSFVARTNAAAAGGAGRGPSTAAVMSNMPASPMRLRPGLNIPNNGRNSPSAAADANRHYVSPATTSSPPGYLQPLHEYMGDNGSANVSLTSTPHRNGAAVAAANAGKSPRKSRRRRAAINSRKNRRT